MARILRPELIIFDCDGVLVDSETLGTRAVSECVADYGLALSPEQCFRLFRGVQMARVKQLIEERLGRALPASFETELRARMAQAFHRELRAVPGIDQVLASLATPYCVASNGPLEKIHLTLRLAGLLDRFTDRIFSAYEVGSWKPDPGLYLHAAKTMGAALESCIVIEDSVAGVEGAVAAGMRVLGFAPHGHGADLAERGAQVFASMRELPELITEAFNGRNG